MPALLSKLLMIFLSRALSSHKPRSTALLLRALDPFTASYVPLQANRGRLSLQVVISITNLRLSSQMIQVFLCKKISRIFHSHHCRTNSLVLNQRTPRLCYLSFRSRPPTSKRAPSSLKERYRKADRGSAHQRTKHQSLSVCFQRYVSFVSRCAGARSTFECKITKEHKSWIRCRDLSATSALTNLSTLTR